VPPDVDVKSQIVTAQAAGSPTNKPQVP